MTLPNTRAKTGLLISQWQGSSVEALTSELLALIDEQLVTPLAEMERQSDITTATGAWLDRIGERLGFPRPTTQAGTASDAFFDFAPPVYAVGRDNNLYTISISDQATLTSISSGDEPGTTATLNIPASATLTGIGGATESVSLTAATGVAVATIATQLQTALRAETFTGADGITVTLEGAGAARRFVITVPAGVSIRSGGLTGSVATLLGFDAASGPRYGTASLSLVGSIGWMPAAIAWANDNLYAIQTDGDIYTLDTADGTPSAAAIRRLSGTTIAAAAVRDGVIWYYSGPTTGNTTPSLRTYDPATDTEDDSAVTTLGIPPAAQPVTAMAWWDDTLYLFGMNMSMYSVDTESGVCTPVPGATLTGSVNAATVLPLGLADPDEESAASAIYTSDPSGNIGRITLNPFNYQSIASVRTIQSMARSGPEGTGFDQSRFASALTELQGRVGIGDEWYRAMLRARARALLSRGNIVDVRAAARLLFDGGAVVNDGDRDNVWAVADATANLYSLDLTDPASPVATSVGALGVNPQALAWHNGTLYAIAFATGVADRLYTVDTDSGVATVVSGTPFAEQIRGLASLGGHLWAIARRNNALYRLDPETGSVTQVGSDLTVGGTCESIVAHEGALYMFTREPNNMYSISTSDASTTDLGSLPARMFGAASVGGYVYMIDIEGNLRRTRPSVSPLNIEAAGAIGHNQARAMTSQFVPTIQYTDSRGEAYGDIAEEHAAALLGLPAGVANSVGRA